MENTLKFPDMQENYIVLQKIVSDSASTCKIFSSVAMHNSNTIYSITRNLYSGMNFIHPKDQYMAAFNAVTTSILNVAAARGAKETAREKTYAKYFAAIKHQNITNIRDTIHTQMRYIQADTPEEAYDYFDILGWGSVTLLPIGITYKENMDAIDYINIEVDIKIQKKFTDGISQKRLEEKINLTDEDSIIDALRNTMGSNESVYYIGATYKKVEPNPIITKKLEEEKNDRNRK